MPTRPVTASLALSTLLPLFSGCILVINKGGGPGSEPGSPGEPPIVIEPETGWIDDTGGVACTDIAVASVVVRVVDLAGNPVSGEGVTYAESTWESPQPAECADEGCTSWIAGYEVGGEVTVWAIYHADTEDPCCWYDSSASQTVTVPYTDDGCHVMTQELTLTLDTTQMSCADADPSTGACG